MSNNKPIADHLGNIYPSTKAMCAHYGIGYRTLNSRLRLKSWGLEQALTTPAGHGYKTDKLLSKYGARVAAKATVYQRLKAGWTEEQAYTTPTARTNVPKTDHLGNSFGSSTAMCAHWGINLSTLHGRIRAGWSLERALTTAPQPPRGHRAVNTGTRAITYQGTKYTSVKPLAYELGITPRDIRALKKKGYTLEEAIDLLLKEGKDDNRKNK